LFLLEQRESSPKEENTGDKTKDSGNHGTMFFQEIFE
jgi:hypothetical protein